MKNDKQKFKKKNNNNNKVEINYFSTAGQEDPFELDSSLLLSSGRHGGVVRGST